MGFWKIILFLTIIFAPLGLLIGAVLMFGGIPLVYRLRRIPAADRKLGFKAKLGLTASFAVLFAAVMCVVNIYDVVIYADDFWKSRGGWSHWRIPLEEPYELCMVDTMDQGFIGQWQQAGPIISNIVQYARKGNLIAGETAPDPPGAPGLDEGGSRWFLFDCADGNLARFDAWPQLQQAWYDRGNGPLSMRTVRDHWYRYWKIVDDGR